MTSLITSIRHSVRCVARAAGGETALLLMIMGVLAQIPVPAAATHLGLEQLGLVTVHTAALVGSTGVGLDPLGVHFPVAPASLVEQDEFLPYPGQVTSQTGLGLAQARATVLFGAGTFPSIQLHVASDVSQPAASAVATSFAYWQDELTITVAGLPMNTQLMFFPVFSISGNLSATGGGQSGFEIVGARLNPGLGGVLAADSRSLGDQFCTAGDVVNCGAVARLFSSVGIPFFNGSPFTFKFMVGAFASQSAQADLGSSIGWEGVEIRDLGGNPHSASVASGAGIDYTVPTSIPEPGIVALLSLTVVGLSVGRRRQTR